MAIENWLTGREMFAVAAIVNAMTEKKMYLGELGGDVLRIPMSKLKKAGYKFVGCDIAGDYTSLEELRGSFQKIDMDAKDTDESINSLAEAVGSVIGEIQGTESVETETESVTEPAFRKHGRHKIYPF